MLDWEKGQNRAIPEFQFHQFILHLHRALPSKNINNDKGRVFKHILSKSVKSGLSFKVDSRGKVDDLKIDFDLKRSLL